MNIVAPFVAVLLLSMQADNAALLTRLKTLDNAAAVAVVGCRNDPPRARSSIDWSRRSMPRSTPIVSGPSSVEWSTTARR